ncbi:hypothetical protein [Pedobacter miscanthi]|uniref:hypothetical protein n=1 Tax=Pedobacter miscanthi TaxID=2259170 RepID=UPI00292E34F4|nr:hypothetical protein [Pedobacter miscanthi]
MDTYRELLGAFNVMPETLDEIKLVQDKELEGFREFYEYNRLALETARFVNNALLCCKENLNLNEKQLSKISGLKVVGTFDSIATGVETAIDIINVNIKLTEDAPKELARFSKDARNILYREFNHVDGLNEITIKTGITPTEKGGIVTENSFEFSEDNKKLVLKAFVRASYDEKGQLSAYDYHCEFNQYFVILVADAKQAYKPFIK